MAYADPECVPTMAVPRALVLALLPVAVLAAPTLVDVAAAAGPAFAAAPAKHGGGRAAEHRAPHGLRSLDRGAFDRGAPGHEASRGAAGRGAAGHAAAGRRLAPGRPVRSDPYAGHGLTIVLPDGRHVRFIEPAPPTPAAPPAPPAGSPSSTAPAAANAPAPVPSGRGTGTDPGDAVSASQAVLPVPVIQSLFPPLPGGAAGRSGAPAAASAPGAPPASGAPPNGGTAAADGTPIGRTGATAPTAGSGASATAGQLPSAPAGARGTAGDAAAPAPAVGRIEPGWPPMPSGPPPLGPQSLARPQPVDLVPPRTAETDYSGTLRHRLLPLGLGLALIGAGAALFGWKLRRL